MTVARTAALIVAWNGKQDLSLCLSSLYEILKNSQPIDVYLVDNASTDGTVEWLEEQYSSVKIIPSSENLGFAGGNNLGLKYLLELDYEYILLLNQDIIAKDDFLTPLISCLDQHPEISMAQPVILQYRVPDLVNTDGNPIHFLGFGFSGNCDRPFEAIEQEYGTKQFISVPATSGAAVLIRSNLLKEIGLFDDFFFTYNEDLDLAWRARLVGTDLVLCPLSRIYHNYEYKRSTQKKTSLLERNRIATLLKNYRLGTILLLSPVLLLFEIFMLLYAARQKWFTLKIQGYRELAAQKPSLREKRRQIQKLRRVTDRYISDWFTSELEFEQVNGPIINLGNFFLKHYWKFTKHLILW